MTLNILIVDDSRTARLIARDALSLYDCRFFEAKDGVEGLETARREKPDLILLDITMELMTGEEMLARIKDDPDLKDIKVIMLTAVSDQDSIIRSVKLGASGYIKKPFTDAQLIEGVKKAVPLTPG